MTASFVEIGRNPKIATDVDGAGVHTLKVTGGGGGTSITTFDEGVTLSTATASFNFVGAGVTATNVGNDITVTILAGGTVTSVSVVTANGVSGSVANPTTTPAITLTLGAITPTSVAASNTVTGSNLSGTNTGDQTITLTGDVTGSGPGSFVTTIAGHAVSNAKFRQGIARSVVGVTGNATADVADIQGAANTALQVNAAGTALTFTAIDVSTAIITGVQGVANGGTGQSTLTVHGVLIGNAANGINATAAGTSGQLLTSQGAADPQYKDNLATITFIVDGGGSTITTGMKGYLEIPFACTINRVTTLADQSGSIVVDIFKCTYAQFDAGSTHPVSGDKITASAPPTISSATKAQDATLTGWTTAISAGDILAFNVNSITTCQRVTVSLKVTKS